MTDISNFQFGEIVPKEVNIKTIEKKIHNEKAVNLDPKCEICDKSNESISKCLDSLISGLQQTP